MYISPVSVNSHFLVQRYDVMVKHMQPYSGPYSSVFNRLKIHIQGDSRKSFSGFYLHVRASWYWIEVQSKSCPQLSVSHYGNTTTKVQRRYSFQWL
jgi:hypothetical protein